MHDDRHNDLPFAGLKVIDCASFIAAPCAATVLSDFGADVIKVEPLEGDAYRELYRMPGLPAIDRNFAWDLDSRNKRSIALDLKSPDAQAVLYRLVEQADVFITNLPLPARGRLNIGYETLGPLNPRMIYASFTAYGETGPEADKTGFDSTAYWARSGLMDLMRADHRTPPARSAAGFGDHPSGIALYGAIVTALYRRMTTGLGGHVDSSLLANGLWANSFFAQARLYGATIPPRPPRELVANSLTNGYRCRDGRWLNLVLLNEARQFRPLLKALGCAELADDPRFATQAARMENAPALTQIFDRLFAEHDLAEWRQRFDAAGVTFGIVGTLDDLLHDEQMRAVEALVPGHDGVTMTISSPINIEGVRKVPPGPAPAIGEHGAEILRDAGYADADIQRLRDLKVLL